MLSPRAAHAIILAVDQAMFAAGGDPAKKVRRKERGQTMRYIAMTLLALAIGGWASNTTQAASPVDHAAVANLAAANATNVDVAFRYYYGAPGQYRLYRDYGPYYGNRYGYGYNYGYRYSYPRYYGYYNYYGYPRYAYPYRPYGYYGYYRPGLMFPRGY